MRLFIKRINNKWIRALVAFNALFLLGCGVFPWPLSAMENRSIDISRDTEWLGEFANHRKIMLREDLIRKIGSRLASRRVIYVSNGVEINCDVADFIQNPHNCPGIELVNRGIVIEWTSIKVYHESTHSFYELHGNILNGRFAGESIVIRPYGDPHEKGTLRLGGLFAPVDQW